MKVRPAHIKTIFDFVPNIVLDRLISFCDRCSYSILQVAVDKAREQGVFEEFSTQLAVVHSTRISPDVSTSWTSLISLSNTISCFCTRTLSV